MSNKRKHSSTVEKTRGETWVGKRPAVYKDRKKDVNRQGEQRKPKHKKTFSNYSGWGSFYLTSSHILLRMSPSARTLLTPPSWSRSKADTNILKH